MKDQQKSGSSECIYEGVDVHQKQVVMQKVRVSDDFDEISFVMGSKRYNFIL